jgi:predicted CoA-binding protein
MLNQEYMQQIQDLLTTSRTIAVVGLSPKKSRPSNMVGRYLMDAGFQVIPVNPAHSQILSTDCYPNLAAIPYKIDIVDIFRKAEDVQPIVEQAIKAGVRAVWMQQGIINETAATLARNNGLICIMDLCIKVEHARLNL